MAGNYEVVSDSSPLIILAHIAGAGLPGDAQTAQADWIEVRPVKDARGIATAIVAVGLGAGELSAVFLARELKTGLVLIDERRARRYAREQGLAIIGCVGILEHLYAMGMLGDLRGAHGQMLQQKVRIDLQTLQLSLAKFKLPALA